jgi:hypothetical protein
MKNKTRDNLIYLTVGIGLVALIVMDLFYADSHHLKMLWPSRFASRAAYTTALLGYFVIRETSKVKATLLQVFASVLFSGILHLAIIFALHQIVGELPGLSFSALILVEMFVVIQLSMVVLRYLRSGSRS